MTFRDWVYEHFEEEQEQLDKYFTEDLEEEDTEDELPF